MFILLCCPARLPAKGVPDRDADTFGMVIAEFKVIADEVDTNFRSYEKTAIRVKLKTGAHVPQQVIAAHKIGTGECSASHKVLVKANAFAAHTSQKFKRGVLSERWGIHRIEVVEDRPERSKTAGKVLGRAPRYLAAYSKMLEQQEVATEARKDSAAYILREEIAGSIGG